MDDKHVLTIERILNAPREKVWLACTDEIELSKWWGQPKDGVMPFAKLDFKEGGSFHFMVELPGDIEIWGKSVYKEIVEPERLVFDEYFSDEAGTLTDDDELPKSEITLTLLVEGSGTKLIVRHEGFGVAPHTILEYKEGWGESLDRLERALKLG